MKYNLLKEKQECYLIEILPEDQQVQKKYYNEITKNYFGVKRWIPCSRVSKIKNVNFVLNFIYFIISNLIYAYL